MRELVNRRITLVALAILLSVSIGVSSRNQAMRSGGPLGGRPGATFTYKTQAPDTPAVAQRIVYSPDQAMAMAQAWVEFKSDRIREWRGSTAAAPVIYSDLDGMPAAYVFSVRQDSQEVGYLILSHELRDDPVLEFSTNPAPHLRCGQECQAAAVRRGLRLVTARPIYLGPLDYFYEALPESSINPNNRRWLVPMGGEQVVEIEHQPGEITPPESSVAASTALDDQIADTGATQMIYGLPDYDQFFGTSYGYDFSCYSGCTPTAATNMAHFWAAAGYPNLSDADWRDTTADLREHMETFCIGTTGSTWTHTAAPGLVSFAQDRGYSFGSLQYCWPTSLNWSGCDNREFTWQRYTAEIDQCRPPLLSIANHPIYGSHTVTGVGYDTYGGNYYIVHDNWRSTPREVWILHEDVENRYRFLYPFIPPSVDHTPPTSATVNPLPTYQASTDFEASWSGADTFPGIGSFDVQYRDGLNGEWQWWLEGTTSTAARLSDYLSLRGGHTFYLRVRARDKHCNTSDWSAPLGSVADADPPITAVNSQPRYRTERGFDVSWGGSDDASGIASYDIWTRANGGEWTSWQTGISTTAANYSNAQVGGTYYFLSLGTDRLGRRETKDESDYDTLVTIARHSVGGRVLGNREQPAFYVQISSSSAYTHTQIGTQGEYTLFFPASGEIAITLSAPSRYGTLPPMAGIALTDAVTDLVGVDLVLPPADNTMQNSHFEESNLADQWILGGSVVPTLTHQAHTGLHALALGMQPGRIDASSTGSGTGTLDESGEWHSTISQTVTLSPTVEKPTLSWFYTISGTAQVSDTLKVTIVGSHDPISYAAPLNVNGWSHAWLPLDDAVLGQQVTVTFDLHRSGDADPFLVVLDEITLGSGDEGPEVLYLPITLK